MKTAGLPLVLCLLPACAPSRASLFDPVSAAVARRAGVEPRWTDGAPPAAVEKRVQELLAAPLTAERAALVAVLASPALQAVYQDLAAAGAEVTSARSLPNPELEAELGYPLSGDHEPEIELEAKLDLTALLARLPRSSIAAAELRATRRDVTRETIDLAARARVELFEAAAAEARLALRRTVAETAAAAAELARKLHEAGNVTDLDLVRDSLFDEDAQLALRAAEADAVAAREALAATLGVPPGRWRIAERVLEAEAPRLDVTRLEREAIAASLELDADRERVDAARGRVSLARLESLLPHLAAGVSAGRDDDDWHAGPAISLSVPLFDWGGGRRAAAWADLRRRQHARTATELELAAAARAARERLLSAEARVGRIRDRLLPLRERLIDESVKQYNAMNLGPFELLQIRREQIAIEERHIDALRDAWIARVAVWQLRAGSRPAAADRRATPSSPGPAARDGH
jgi:cobalt-zinc-cadmium efflux system outer membrane protein